MTSPSLQLFDISPSTSVFSDIVYIARLAAYDMQSEHGVPWRAKIWAFNTPQRTDSFSRKATDQVDPSRWFNMNIQVASAQAHFGCSRVFPFFKGKFRVSLWRSEGVYGGILPFELIWVVHKHIHPFKTHTWKLPLTFARLFPFVSVCLL